MYQHCVSYQRESSHDSHSHRKTMQPRNQHLEKKMSGQDRGCGGNNQADVTAVARVMTGRLPRGGGTGHSVLTKKDFFTSSPSLVVCGAQRRGRLFQEGQMGQCEREREGAARAVPAGGGGSAGLEAGGSAAPHHSWHSEVMGISEILQVCLCRVGVRE